MLPIIPGVAPFGAVMGALCFDTQLSLFQTISLNFIVFAGASQLAAIDLMANNATTFIVIVTGLIINLRFLLYSAALSPVVHHSNWLIKLSCAYTLTDQSYAATAAHYDQLTSSREKIIFYFGASLCMLLGWHLSVIAGYIFGNFAPPEWSLDYAVPLSFVALVIPSLKSSNHVRVALFSSLASILFYSFPFKTGLMVTALLSIGFAAFLTGRKTAS